MCVMAVGWKCTPARVHIKESVREWAEGFSLQSLREFLAWRSPGIAFGKNAEEEKDLLEAEQQAYAVQMENISWKMAESSKEQVTEAAEADNKADSKTVEEKAERVITETAADENNMPFSEYIQTAMSEHKLLYSWEQLTDFNFITDKLYQIHGNTTIYPSQLKLEEFLKKDLSIDRESEGPQILIYHTHGSEYFKDSDKENPDTLITGVGDALQDILEEKYGYNVYHDTTVFPYNSSYSRGREKVQQLMEKYPDIQVIIDMHRDSSPNTHLVTEIDGKPTAQIMFFNGMSQTVNGPLASRNNENLPDNLAFSLQMKLAADQLYPGFARKNYLKAYRYNMDLAGRYTLIEVGAETNTLEEEINAMEPLAEVLHCVLQ